jgi:hypothetical protein
MNDHVIWLRHASQRSRGCSFTLCAMTSLTPPSTLRWRTSLKNRASPSLSLVIAKPQLSSPLASAVTLLPAINMTNQGRELNTLSTTVQGVVLSQQIL